MLLTKFGVLVSGLVVGLAIGYLFFSHSQSKDEVLQPDTPPGEYLYLDRNRVHSYLSQLVDGLADQEKRTLAKTEDLSAEVKAGSAGLGGKRSQSTSSEAQIKPTPADRFYLLLRLLRNGESKEEHGTTHNWLFDIHADAQNTDATTGYAAACRIREGDFVRIYNAHLRLAPYAAVLPKATYAALNRQATYVTPKRETPGHVAIPDQKVFEPRTKKQRLAIRRYLHLLGKDPRLPFVVRTVWAVPKADPSARITFFIPALYSSLRNEPSLISGTLNIVGKVVYRNLSRPVGSAGNRIGCGDTDVPATVPKYYIDRQTVSTFVPALHGAPPFVYNNLRFKASSTAIDTSAKDLIANMTFAPPVMVVVPIAMYQ